MQVHAFGARSADSKLEPVVFERQNVRDGEVAIRITHCGVCHSDLHQARDDWENTNYPCVPGHEIVGEVTAVGRGVSRFAEGDRVGVGCMVDSCRQCASCKAGEEQYCTGPRSCTLTYNGPKAPDGTNSYGGYSTDIVVREEFVLRVPDALSSAVAGPIMCAGITVYSPMKHWGLERGQRLGVAGIGGLGHMAVQIGKAMGAHVVALTRSMDEKDRILALGADEVVDSRDEGQLAELAASLDMLIDTIPVPHELEPFLQLMAPNSTLVVVGNIIGFPGFSPGPMVFNRIQVAGSLIGGIADTQEILDFCAEHGIEPSTEIVGIDDVNDVFDTLAEGRDDVFRHVIDMDTLRFHGSARSKAREIAAPTRGVPT